MKSVQKILKAKQIVKISFYSDKLKKWPNLQNGQTCFFMASALRKYFEISHEMANLASLFNSHMWQNAYSRNLK